MIKEINILGVVYQVSEVDVVNREELRRGEINYMTNEIRIDRNLVQSAKEQTLMHEILHAVFDLLGLDELNADENKVQGIATALHHVLTSQAIFGFQPTTYNDLTTEKHYEDLINGRVQARTGKEKIVQDVIKKDAGMILAMLGLDHPASKMIFKYLVEQKKKQCGCMSFLLESQKNESAT